MHVNMCFVIHLFKLKRSMRFMFISQSSVLRVLWVYRLKICCFVVTCLGHDWRGTVRTVENLRWCNRIYFTSPNKNKLTLPVSRGLSKEEHFTLMASTNLDGTGRYLDLVQFPHCAITIDEVGRSQLMKGFHILSRIGKLPVQLVFGQVHRQRLLS